MKLTVIHDIDGNILRLIASPVDGPSVRPELDDGERATEIDAPDLNDPDVVPEQLADLRANYRLELDDERGRLVRRD